MSALAVVLSAAVQEVFTTLIPQASERVLSEDDRVKILVLCRRGERPAQIARKLNLNQATVARVIRKDQR